MMTLFLDGATEVSEAVVPDEGTQQERQPMGYNGAARRPLRD